MTVAGKMTTNFFGDEADINADESMQAPERDPAAPGEDLLRELEDYVGSLGRMVSSINAILEYEYNTPQKAQELVKYYAERPGLAEYTRSKELPRMSYHVILPNGNVETNKQTIATYHLPDDSLLARCANQSLLADLFHVLTGSDLVIRPQFLAFCVARTCQFRLHYGDHGRDMLQVNCMLELSLPVAEGPRLHVATIRATIEFSPKLYEPPTVKFKIDKIVVTLKGSEYSKLQQVVNFLKTMEGHFDEVPGRTNEAWKDAPADFFRDAFLEESQHLMNQSKAGMKSALKDVESVIGLKSKLKAVQVGISKFLPDTNVLLEAEEEARRLAAERDAHQALNLRSPYAANPADAPPTSARQHSQPLPSLIAMQGHVVKEDAPRPRSILGGFVATGWGALAKSITIPDEDPAIYGLAPPQERPVFYQKEKPAGEQVPLSWRVEEMPAVPKQYQKPDPPGPVKAPEDTVPYMDLDILQQDEPGEDVVELDLSFEEEFGDGWDDDLDHIVAEVQDEEEQRVDHNNDNASLLQDADTSKQERVAASSHVVSMAYGLSDVRPTNIPSLSQSSTQVKRPPLHGAKAPLSKISSYSGSSPRPTPADSLKPLTRRPLIAEISYNPEDDIIPTRKRWVNPRPNRPYLFITTPPC
jgi:hypothetical protein